MNELTEGLQLVNKAVEFDKQGKYSEAISHYDKSVAKLEAAYVGRFYQN